MSFLNKRKIERYELSLPAYLKFRSEQGEKAMEHITKNISSKGAFFYSNRPIPNGTGVNVDLLLPNRAHINVNGIVIRSVNNGIAVLFDNKYQLFPR